ncbi:DUF6130 family protein [Pseudoduganella sp. RAF53_2]|uniref:DUF6130 family protein n=1 Tax=unclassified Pseudoduganella TaxID=2637179 RepID=UPI003F9E05BF
METITIRSAAGGAGALLSALAMARADSPPAVIPVASEPAGPHTSGNPVIIVSLDPGPHKVLLKLADPSHKILTGEAVTVTVTVPDTRAGKPHDH